MRLFLGLEVPEDIKHSLDKSLGPIKTSAKGWENPTDFHLTLLFIGEASEEECRDIQRRMQEITFNPFTLATGQLRFFNRRILYLDFNPSSELTQLKDQIENKFSEWLKPHRKPFIPHLTIKRWQRYEYDELEEKIIQHPLNSLTFQINRLALFKSEKDEFNQKYHVIKTHPE